MTEQKQFRPFDDLDIGAIVCGAKKGYDAATGSKNILEDDSSIISDDETTIALLSDSLTFFVDDKADLLDALRSKMYNSGVDERTLAYVVSQTEQLKESDIESLVKRIVRNFDFVSKFVQNDKYNLDNDTIMLISLYKEDRDFELGEKEYTKNLCVQALENFDGTRDALKSVFQSKTIEAVGKKKFDFLSAYLTLQKFGRFSTEDKSNRAKQIGKAITDEFGFDRSNLNELFTATTYFMSGINGRTQAQGLGTLGEISDYPYLKSKWNATNASYIASRKGSDVIKSYVEKYMGDSQ